MFKQCKRVTALIVSICMLFSVMVPAVFAQDTSEYATREYIVSEFVRSVGRSKLDASDAVLDMFTDKDAISPEYSEDISRAVVGGILKGYEDRTIRPAEPVSRVEAMVMLARTVPELDAFEEEIVFTDVPEWATEEISYLTKAGLVKGYGDGTMGADDYITVEQVGFLVERSDSALSVVTPGDSFYGYINEKDFRNAVLENATEIDPIHGAVVTKHDSWSNFDDIYNDIVDEEQEILEKLMNGEIEYEKGSVEQRIHDMLKCIDSNIAVSESDKKNISDMRSAIMEVETIEELLDIAEDIYLLAGVNILFDIDVAADKETGIVYPTFSVATCGDGGILGFRKSTNTDAYKEIYAGLISDYLSDIGAEFTNEEILSAIEFQIRSSHDEAYPNHILTYIVFAQIFDVYTDDDVKDMMQEVIDGHPEYYDEETETFIDPILNYVTKDRDSADKTYTGFDLCKELAAYGFTNLEKIIVPDGRVAREEKEMINQKNLTELKINALLRLNTILNVCLSEEEERSSSRLASFPLMLYLTTDVDEMKKEYEKSDEEAEEDIEIVEDTTGLDLDEGILSSVNLNKLISLLPNDIGLIHCKYYFDDEVSEVVANMFDDIWDAYEARFVANTWMSEETKENAIKKLDNMLAVISYPDNYTFPEITPVEEGGTLFSNVLSIKKHNLAELIRCNEDKEFIRTKMLMAPDTVNACYIPSMNTINVPAGILNYPFYDKDGSYASNLGRIGMVIAHEVGHAFDAFGSQYDENGCEKNWWTKSDLDEFKKIQDYFVEYYNQFEVIDGVVQDASITLTENMADFAAVQILMDIIGDDQQAQKECFEAYASTWAQLGTSNYLTDSYTLSDVHSSNGVRVNAVVASFQQFYDIYGIEEGDPMYVAPEDRLRLW